jgi:hypothetical protein
MISCSVYRSEYYHKKNNENFEPLDESDITNLRPHLLCDILAIYEYLANKSGVVVADWFIKYANVKCDMKDNDDYTCYLRSPLAPENAELIYKDALSSSIEPFKSRGICKKVFNDSI